MIWNKTIFCLFGYLMLLSYVISLTKGFKLEEDLRKHFDIFKDLKYDVRKLQRLNNLWRKKLGLPNVFHEVVNLDALENGKPADVDERCELSKSKDSALKYQGDIILAPKQLDMVLRSALSRRRSKRKVIKDPVYHWKSTTIHYTMDEALDAKGRKAIAAAIKHWQTETCMRFRKGPSENYVHFFPGQGCYSSVGLVGNRQGISIGLGCDTMGIVAHEIGHALGFWHEQSRPDRDEFISINYDNLMPQVEGNFQKSTWQQTTNGGELYDLGSIMHYGPTAFTDNGENTIDTNDPTYQHTIGQRKQLSFIDVKQANQLYCKDVCKKSKTKCSHEGYRDPNNCNKCKCPAGFGGRTCNEPASSDKGCKSRSLLATTTKKRLSSGRVTKADMYCSWLVKCKRGKARVQLIKTEFYCRGTCYDFVEIKRSNFSQTGARFCCNPPTQPLKADGPVISITMQTTEDATTGFDGFQLDYWCEGNEPGIVVPKRRKPTPKPKLRTNKPTWENTTPRPKKDGIWSRWGPWTTCSATCGYCGQQQRRRTCANGNCKGKSVETRRCAPQICNRNQPIGTGKKSGGRSTCTKKFDSPCSWTSYLKTKYQTVKLISRSSGDSGQRESEYYRKTWSRGYRNHGGRGRQNQGRNRGPHPRPSNGGSRRRGGRHRHRTKRGSRRNGNGDDSSTCTLQVTGECEGFLKQIRNGARKGETMSEAARFMSGARPSGSNRGGRQRGRSRRGRHYYSPTTSKLCCLGTPNASGICLRRRF